MEVASGGTVSVVAAEVSEEDWEPELLCVMGPPGRGRQISYSIAQRAVGSYRSLAGERVPGQAAPNATLSAKVCIRRNCGGGGPAIGRSLLQLTN